MRIFCYAPSRITVSEEKLHLRGKIRKRTITILWVRRFISSRLELVNALYGTSLKTVYTDLKNEEGNLPEHELRFKSRYCHETQIDYGDH